MNVAPDPVSVLSSDGPLPQGLSPAAHLQDTGRSVKRTLAGTASSRWMSTVRHAIATGLVLVSVLFFITQLVRPVPFHIAGLTIDRLSAVLTLLVAGVGAVTYFFSIRYLAGDPRRERFLNWLLMSVVSAYLLMLSTNLLVLGLTWFLTSLGLHKLLTHYSERTEGVKAARKKFVISRIGDVALVGVIGVVWWQWGTLDLNTFHAMTSDTPATGAMTAVALLIVLAAATKSAQFPFHSWLPETMESPTPVSALMHAGIINAGGALLLRAAPLLVKVPEALLLLTVVGTITAVMGAIAMWAQIKVKRTLAWSTVSQMGFMMVQCGLAAYPAALLHIVAHGCYKAWSFLRSGEITHEQSIVRPSAGRALLFIFIGMAVSVPAMMLAHQVTGFSPMHSPGELALAAFVAMSVGQVWLALLSRPQAGRVSGMVLQSVISVGVTCGVTIVAFFLYQVALLYLLPVIGNPMASGSTLVWIAAALPVLAVLGLMIGHAVLPVWGGTPRGRALRVHALHGFYFGALADRFINFVWPTRSPKGL